MAQSSPAERKCGICFAPLDQDDGKLCRRCLGLAEQKGAASAARKSQPRKTHLCRECGTTDPKKFAPAMKGLCRKCQVNRRKPAAPSSAASEKPQSSIAPPAGLVNCHQCGNQFEPWKLGNTIIHRWCPSCLKEKRFGGERPEVLWKECALILNFGAHLQQLTALREIAVRELRTVNQQALYFLLRGMDAATRQTGE